MKNRIYSVFIILCLSIPAVFSQTDYNVEAITVINLGDGRLLHRTVNDNLPIEGELRIIDGRRSEYKLVEFTNGLYDGSYKHFKSNVLTEEGTYKEGRKNGIFTEYFSDGTSPKSVKTYTEGKPNGLWITFYTNGAAEKEKGYKDGLEDGIERIYDYETGEMVTEMNFANGKKEGPQRQRILSNRGTYTIESSYKNGLLDGNYSEVYETGEIRKEGKYKNGKEEGVWMFYKSGGLPEKQETFKNGVRDGLLKKYFTDGTVSNEEMYKNGKQDGEVKEYYYQSDGKLKSVYNYTNGRRNGKFTLYNQDGTIKQEGVYENGVKKQ